MKAFSKQLIEAIETCGVSRYRIGKETGISPATLSRLVNGDGWIGRKAMDDLAEYLSMKLQTVKPRAKRPGR